MRRASGRAEGETRAGKRRKICRLLSVPPAPLSCILPGERQFLMFEGDDGKRICEVKSGGGVGGGRET